MHREHRRVPTAFFTACGGVHTEQMRRIQWPDHPDARHADAHVQEVDETVLLEPGGDLGGVVRSQTGAVALLLVADQPEPDGDAIADRGPHRRQHLDAEAHSVVEVAAVLVGAAVALRRQELVDQVAVGAVDLDAVESAGGGVGGRLREVLDDLGDLVALERLRRLVVVGDCGRRPHRQLRQRPVVDAAVVSELEERERAVLVDRRGDLPEVRHRGVVPRDRVVAHLVRGRRVHLRLPGDDHAGAAPGPLAEVAAVALAVEPGLPDRAAGSTNWVKWAPNTTRLGAVTGPICSGEKRRGRASSLRNRERR